MRTLANLRSPFRRSQRVVLTGCPHGTDRCPHRPSVAAHPSLPPRGPSPADRLPLHPPFRGALGTCGLPLTTGAALDTPVDLQTPPPTSPQRQLDPVFAALIVVNRATSQRLSTAVNAQDCRCYENALCALPRLDNAA